MQVNLEVGGRTNRITPDLCEAHPLDPGPMAPRIEMPARILQSMGGFHGIAPSDAAQALQQLWRVNLAYGSTADPGNSARPRLVTQARVGCPNAATVGAAYANRYPGARGMPRVPSEMRLCTGTGSPTLRAVRRMNAGFLRMAGQQLPRKLPISAHALRVRRTDQAAPNCKRCSPRIA